MSSQKLCFKASYTDEMANLIKYFSVIYTPVVKTIEMIDIKTKKKYLSNFSVPSIELHHLFIGAFIIVCSRKLHIIDYGNKYTKDTIGSMNLLNIVSFKALDNSNIFDKINEIAIFMSYVEQEGFRLHQISHQSDNESSCIYIDVYGEKLEEAINTFKSKSTPSLCITLIHTESNLENTSPESILPQIPSPGSGIRIAKSTAFYFTPPVVKPVPPNVSLCVVRPHIFGR